ncbi:hypothetical protein [Bacillus pseudomycoides]|uniref:hypothetical protein n=1 Tax=Bacillus pseudomycoides TaxID=64104 RepID=UPI0028D320C8|nr:hypothetical protein [Bacillus pseudomycoides]
MPLILVFLLILLGFFLSTYMGFFLWEHLKIVKYLPSIIGFITVVLIFTFKKNTYGWEGLGFGILQFIILLASCLTLVFAATLETKSSMN